MLDWHLRQIYYPLEIKLLLLLKSHEVKKTTHHNKRVTLALRGGLLEIG